MVDKRSSNEFGLDPAQVKVIDWDLAAERVLVDVRSDFIYAPHISNVFRHAGEELADTIKTELKNGRFAPGAPVTIEVPKTARMQMIPPGGRGPSFSRPGSILLPKDRLLYQALADAAAPIIEKATDRKRSFSHRLAGRKDPEMFESSRTCWNNMQQALNAMSGGRRRGYVIKADVASCFASVNQHTLINHLEAIGYPSTLRKALDAFLVLTTGDRNSRGLLQGVFPSDLFGNFYLNPIDEYLKDLQVPSVRYVDDLYIFASSLPQAEELTRGLTIKLRDYDLGLNEAKSKLLRSRSLVLEEPDLEKLFSEALKERAEEAGDDEELDADYGFQSEWEDDEGEGTSASSHDDPELRATEALFDSISEFSLHAEKIERFCLPLFAAAGSGYAVDYVLRNFAAHPAMSQIYSAYLAKFCDNRNVSQSLTELMSDDALSYDWQRMWVLAALMRQEKAAEKAISAALRTYKDGTRHEALRAVAAVLVAKHGSFTRQKELMDSYGATGSTYMQTALVYGARYFQTQLRKSAMKSWSAHSQTHSLVAESIAKL